MITKGSNRPLVIALKEEIPEDYLELHVDLHRERDRGGTVLRHWKNKGSTEEIEILNKQVLICPITQAESSAFLAGHSFCSVKFLDADGITHECLDLPISVRNYPDLTIMGDDTPIYEYDLSYTGELSEAKGLLNPDSIRTAIVIKAGYCTDSQAVTAVSNWLNSHKAEIKGEKGDKGNDGVVDYSVVYSKAEVDAKDSATLASAKSYTDSHVPTIDAYTKSEVDGKLAVKSNISHKHDSLYQAKLTAGKNITIDDDGTISASGGGMETVYPQTIDDVLDLDTGYYNCPDFYAYLSDGSGNSVNMRLNGIIYCSSDYDYTDNIFYAYIKDYSSGYEYEFHNNGFYQRTLMASLESETNALKEDIFNIKSGLQKDAAYHLGFYLDENGDLCQVDNEEV